MMICGIRQTGKENKEREYDYMGVFYPEGHVGENYQFLFDHENIDNIFFRGFEDVERQDFIERLDNYYKNEANVKQERADG